MRRVDTHLFCFPHNIRLAAINLFCSYIYLQIDLKATLGCDSPVNNHCSEELLQLVISLTLQQIRQQRQKLLVQEVMAASPY